ncbi:hypothetical protein IP023_11575 [Sphingobacterium rhinopitheci]|nr:hypothetical protein [Sphingobacterium rhinopitheci]
MKTNKSIHTLNIEQAFMRIIFILFVLTLASISCTAQILFRTVTTSTPTWNITPTAITEAGNDYSSEYSSAENQILLNAYVPLIGLTGLGNGKISVHQENSTWNNLLTLSIKRTGPGTLEGICVNCKLYGSLNEITLTNIPQEIFNIEAVLSIASYTNIPLQLKLRGVSVVLPVKNYATKVIFTITAI